MVLSVSSAHGLTNLQRVGIAPPAQFSLPTLVLYLIAQKGSNQFEEQPSGLYRKEVIKFGSYRDKFDATKKMTLNRQTAEEVVANFKRYPDVPIPPSHWEDNAVKNTGWVKAFHITDRGLDAELDIISKEAKAALSDGRVRDVSVGIYHNYEDNESGESVGARVHHVALTNEPYLKGMKGFEQFSEGTDFQTLVADDKETELTERLVELQAENFEIRRFTAWATLSAEGRVVPADKDFFEGVAKDEDGLELVVKYFKGQRPKVSFGEQTGPQFMDRNRPGGSSPAVREAFNLTDEEYRKYSKEGS